ncbi:aminopeptidase N-like isoform X2 [Heterodontus francisci]|uniref:aminopeptidase N-like isoform X2 n=1 Tax=Heterodontus francisci TaxID=7792 RepID=UPI00355C7AB7
MTWIRKALTILGLVVAAQASNSGRASEDSPAGVRPPVQKPWKAPQLPDTLIPINYEVELWPWLFRESSSGLFLFYGRSVVTFQCLNRTNFIIIHSKMLNYTKPMRVSRADNTTVTVSKFWEEKANEYLVLVLDSPLEKGDVYTLQTAFRGELTDALVGLYRSEYEEDGTTKILAMTMMQPTDARKIFPCFDEPALKATFDLTVIHWPDHSAISNMPVNSRAEMWIQGQIWIVTTFDRTLKMSSYLLACVVSEFQFIEEVFNGIQFKVWGRKQAIIAGQGAYALKAAGRFLEYYEQKCDIFYPLKKLDLVAVPSFESGGMENWGMIIFREINLLYDPEEDSEKSKQTLMLVLAHELSHQWFGNLVTMQWWNDVWLNEGLATYFSYLGNAFVNPEWDTDSLFAGKSLRFAFIADALANSHPLSPGPQDVTTVVHISQLFDDITYEKSYLREFSYKTVTYADLRAHLNKAVNNQLTVRLPSNLEFILDTWVLQMGYPVVTINTTSGLLTQKHFLLDSRVNVTRSSAFEFKWYIPVTWQKNSSIQDTVWINKTNEALVNEMKVNGQTWVLANINAVGLFRVNYDDDNWDKLLILLMRNRDAIPVINRAQLIDDAFSLARGKYIPITRALETTRYLHMETEYLPWDTLSNHLDFIELMLKETPGYALLEKYILSKVTPVYEYFTELGSPDLDMVPQESSEQFAQEVVAGIACSNGLEKCNKKAKALYSRWMAQPDVNPIPPSLRSVIYCRSVSEGGEAEWDFAWQMLELVTSAAEAQTLRYSLACSVDSSLLTRYLSLTLMPWKIKKQDALATITLVAQNINGKKPAWDFIKANWTSLISEFKNSEAIVGLLDGVTARFSTPEDLQELKEFKVNNEASGYYFVTRIMTKVIERTASYIQWRKENEGEIYQWVNNNL